MGKSWAAWTLSRLIVLIILLSCVESSLGVELSKLTQSQCQKLAKEVQRATSSRIIIKRGSFRAVSEIIPDGCSFEAYANPHPGGPDVSTNSLGVVIWPIDNEKIFGPGWKHLYEADSPNGSEYAKQSGNTTCFVSIQRGELGDDASGEQFAGRPSQPGKVLVGCADNVKLDMGQLLR